MMGLNRRRVALVCAGLGAVGAAGAFTFGATSAQFTSTANAQNNDITAGTVTLAEDMSASHVMSVSNFMPGDGSCYSPPAGAKYTCDYPRNEYALKYTGSDNAFVGLDFTVVSKASQPCASEGVSASGLSPASVIAACSGTGQLPLFDGDSSGGALDLSLTPENGDTAHQLLLDSQLDPAATCSTDASKVVSCTSTIKNVLMPTGYGTAAFNGLQWVPNATDYVQVDTGLPSTAGNQFQGSSATFTLQSHAVQWTNNATQKGHTPDCDNATTFPNGLGSAGTYCPISWS